ncbi:hypothetical protein EUX98_g7718 [Antrodiella citrinella]|uniref:Non-classical export protein 1 n=1 Tax=Antrodiella citrinella TaxID=2447956 RepID=A0A4S4MLD5_9APHY|nr:hypothetical protein EUX98_g7718 [Antrodiella citrinella]
MSRVLLSKTLDPVLGVFTGVFAYYLYENNPRTAPPQEDRLVELLRWKWAKRGRDEGSRSAQDETVDWQAIVQEASKKE